MKKGLPVLDGIIGVGLAVFGVILVSGAVTTNPKHPGHPGALAAALVLLMTLPVVWRRRAPVPVAAVLAAGAVLNTVVIGDMVRCGPALPALLLCAYSLGRQAFRLRTGPTVGALACLMGSAVEQSLTDPNLDAGVIVAMIPMILGLYGVGRLVESRTRLAADLEERNAQLRSQRERRADLAVQADRARIARGLDASLSTKIAEMGSAAETGRQALVEDRSAEAAQEAFGVIQQRGRETLTQMRNVVGTLLEPEPIEPQPSLSQLDRLLQRAGPADIHLHVTGQPRTLPAGVELSVYRALENLLNAYGDVPGSRIEVDVDFAAEAVELTVRGPVPEVGGLAAALAATQARVELHRGSLSSDCAAGRWEATARLPI